MRSRTEGELDKDIEMEELEKAEEGRKGEGSRC